MASSNGTRPRSGQDPTTVPKPDYRELGISGTRLFAGQISEETIPALQGSNAWRTWNGIRNDATGAALLKAITLPIRSARWYVEPASEDPKDVDKADFIHEVLWSFGSQSFDDVARLAIEGMLTFGFNLSEICYSPIDYGDYKGKIGWSKLAWRSQNTSWRWEMDTVNGQRQLVGWVQLPPPYYSQIQIPRNKFLLWTHNQEGDNYDGLSLFRPAYKDYQLRDKLYRIRAIGLERAYMSIPVASLPEGYADDMRDLAKQIVQTIRTDEQAGVIKPAELELELQNWQLNGPVMDNAIQFHNRQMLMSALAQFLDLGSGGGGATGSYALSSDQSELFLYAVNSVANYFSQVINLEPGIPSLVDINFANAIRTSMPHLEHGDIGQRNAQTLSAALSGLAQAGLVTPDDATEDRLRQIFDMPERDETVSPEALKSLADQVFPPGGSYSTHPGQRIPTPLETAAKAAQAKAAAPPPGGGAGGAPAPGHSSLPSGGKGGPPSPQQPPQQKPGEPPQAMAEYSAQFAEARQKFNEMLARRPWERPQGRPTEEQRKSMRATELFTEQLEDVYQDAKYRRNHKPPKPSEVVARNRRPYVVRSADPEEKKPQPPARGTGGRRVVVTRQQAVAKKYRPQLAEALRPRS